MSGLTHEYKVVVLKYDEGAWKVENLMNDGYNLERTVATNDTVHYVLVRLKQGKA